MLKARTSGAPAPVEVPLRVIVRKPPVGVQFALGRTDDGEEHVTKLSRGRDLSFDLVLRARPGTTAKQVNLTGTFAHGTPTTRFIPIGVGTLAGQADSCWTRVIKVMLTGITAAMVRDVTSTSGARLVARVDGCGKNGTPACATVPLLDGGWWVE